MGRATEIVNETVCATDLGDRVADALKDAQRAVKKQLKADQKELEQELDAASKDYISWGRETGEILIVFRDRRGQVVAELMLDNDEGGRDLIGLTPAGDGTLRETHRDHNTARPAPFVRSYYIEAKEVGVPMWPEVYIFVGQNGKLDVPGITRATAIYGADGGLLGILTADFDFRSLNRYMRTVELGEEGIVFLLEVRKDGKLQVIAHPDAPEKLELTAPAKDGQGSAALEAHEVEDPRVHALLSALPADLAQITDNLQELTFDVQDVPYLAGVRMVGGEDRPKWMIVMLLPESEIFGRVESMSQRMILLGLAGIVIVLLFALVVAKRLSSKLAQIARETAEIANLELGAKPPVRSAIVEIDRLGAALEEMKSGLRSFQKFVPRELVRRILSSGKEAALGGERRRITVFFSDIANFTQIAESLGPEALVDLLSAYLDAMTREMLAAGATVDKYIGDAIMAFWGAPQDDEDQCWGACRAALANQRELRRLRGTWSEAGRPELNARIGMHAGDAIVGNFGSEYRLDYTAIGDTVNLASRLEGLNKVYGTRIIMSETVHGEVSDRVVTRLLDKVAAKGRAGGTTIYELVGLPEDVSEDTVAWIALYEAALQRYFERDFEGAVAGFREVLACVPEDGPAAVLCARSEAYLDQPPPAEWNGIFAHDTK